jgi:hypothetical protein
MNPIVKAEADNLIWIIVGLFWVIAQIAGAAAKKKRPPRPPAAEEEEKEKPVLSGDPFMEMLRRLAGKQSIEIPRPAEQKLSESSGSEQSRQGLLRRAEPGQEKPWNPDNFETLPDIRPLRRPSFSRQEQEIKPTGELSNLHVRPQMSTFRSTLPAMKLPTVKLPAMNLSFQTSEKSKGNLPALRKIINPADKRSLRRAMLSHIIFSPPKAFE